MTEHHEGHGAHDEHDAHGHADYKKIYIALLVLLVISILGPEIGIKWVTLLTAFGIAIVKAWMVVQHFMHLKTEKMIVKWFLATSVVLMALYFFGVAPDVMKHEGQRWVNQSALAATERGIEVEHHEEEHGDEDPLAGYVEIEAVMASTSGGFDAASAYQTYCVTCHGAGGAGDGVAGVALDPPPADFTDAAFWAAAPDEQRINVILNGGMAEGLSAAMAGWSAVLDEEQAAQMVEYLRTFQSGNE